MLLNTQHKLQKFRNVLGGELDQVFKNKKKKQYKNSKRTQCLRIIGAEKNSTFLGETERICSTSGDEFGDYRERTPQIEKAVER